MKDEIAHVISFLNLMNWCYFGHLERGHIGGALSIGYMDLLLG